MRDDDDVFAGMREVDPIDRAFDASVEIHEALTARRWVVDRRKPVAADLDRTAGKERSPIETLPFPEMLLGECRLVRHCCGLGISSLPQRIRGLVRAFEIARKPLGIVRKNARHGIEHRAIAAIAADIGLSIDATAILAHRRVTHPPPARRHGTVWNGVLRGENRLGGIRHPGNPSILFHAVVREI